MPLTPKDLERIHQEAYRAGRWDEPEKPLVQRELIDACWQAVHDAMRAEYAAEIERLTERIKDLERVAVSAIEALA